MREMIVGHDLRRDQRGLDEHAVDAVADLHLLLEGLEVDVRGAAVDGLGDDAVHESDDRGVVLARAVRTGLQSVRS